MAVAPGDTIYVLDGAERRVQVFGPDGTFVRSIGRPGQGPGELERPGDLFWGPDGMLWVADMRDRSFKRPHGLKAKVGRGFRADEAGWRRRSWGSIG